jgi:predicted DNA binding protein
MVSESPAMRYVTITMRPTSGYFHPVGQQLADAPDITREAIHHFELLDDGTVALLASVQGNMERYRDILAASPDVIEFAVAGSHEGFGYSQVEPNELNLHLIEQQRSSEFIVQMPVEYTSDGGQRITVIGTAESFADASTDSPEGVTVEIEEIGEYHPTMNQLFSQLTVRQREVLEIAIERGYYENPRQTTHEEIAEHLDITPGSVGQHLRNIEATVFGQYSL